MSSSDNNKVKDSQQSNNKKNNDLAITSEVKVQRDSKIVLKAATDHKGNEEASEGDQSEEEEGNRMDLEDSDDDNVADGQDLLQQ